MNARGRGGHRRFPRGNSRNGGFGNFDADRMKNEGPFSSNGTPPFAPFFQGHPHQQPNQFNSFTGLGSPAMGNTPFYTAGNPYLVNNSLPPYRQPHDLSSAHNARPWYPGDPRVDGARFPAPFLASRPLNEVTLNHEFRPAPKSGALVLDGVGDFQRVLEGTIKMLQALQADLSVKVKDMLEYASSDTVSSAWQDLLRAETFKRPHLDKIGEFAKERGIFLLQSASEGLRRRLNEVSCVPRAGAGNVAHGSQRATSDVYSTIWTEGANLVTSILAATKEKHHLDSAISKGLGLMSYLKATETSWMSYETLKAAHEQAKNKQNTGAGPGGIDTEGNSNGEYVEG